MFFYVSVAVEGDGGPRDRQGWDRTTSILYQKIK